MCDSGGGGELRTPGGGTCDESGRGGRTGWWLWCNVQKAALDVLGYLWFV